MLIPFKELIQKYGISPTGVLHIGANSGQEVNDYYSNGITKTLWCEADPELISSLIGNLRNYSNHLIFNDCISDKDGEEITFHIANNGGQSSSMLALGTHAVVHPEVVYTGSRGMRTRTIKTLFTTNKLKIEDYPFVNIDIQGAEMKALIGFKDLLTKVKYLYLEVNDSELYIGTTLFPELNTYLTELGFVLKEKVMSGNHGWGDAFYINENQK